MTLKVLATTLSILLVVGCASTTEDATPQSDLIVLKYYPDCEYKVLGMVSGRSGIVEGDKNYNETMLYKRHVSFKGAKGTPEQAAEQAKQRAEKLGADAIAIVEYKGSKQRLKLGKGRAVDAEKHIMRAEAIKLCDDDGIKINEPNDRIVKYNQHGARNHGKKFSTQIAFDMLKVDQAQQTTKAEGLLSENIQVNGNVLGMPLGISKAQLLKQLGDPSAIVSIDKTKQAFFYGRKQLFVINNNKVVGFQRATFLLSPHLSNRIPYHDEYDEMSLTINGDIRLEQSLPRVAESLNLKAPKLRNDKLTLQSQTKTTQLSFIRKSGLHDNVNSYTLDGVSVFIKGEKNFDWTTIAKAKNKATFLDLKQGILESKPGLHKADVIAALGLPTLSIQKSDTKDTWVYGDNLIVDFLRDGMLRYTLESSKSRHSKPKCTQCLYLGQPKREIPNQYVKARMQNQITVESNGFSYLVAFSEQSQRIDDIQVYVKTH
ncbi:hypothetical protein ACFSJY_16585 [Thalassotalea euphylliae]|uniref:hypothetical protein n=1 Tax=Thalassotalea euphylliae TaxID=1655234 RepID=UPI00362BA72B